MILFGFTGAVFWTSPTCSQVVSLSSLNVGFGFILGSDLLVNIPLPSVLTYCIYHKGCLEESFSSYLYQGHCFICRFGIVTITL